MGRRRDPWAWGAHAWPAAFVVPLVAWLMTVNLGDVPEPWFDEGIHVNAAHTLATTGRYGLTDASGLSPHDPRVQVGPTVVVPVAMAFRLARPGMAVARLPIVLYGVACLALAFLVTWRLSGRHAGAAWVAVCWLACASPEPFTSVGFASRNVVGEVPALAFLLLGLACLGSARGQATRRPGWAFVAGVAWGLAAITKGQLALLLPIVLAIATFLAFWRDRREGKCLLTLVGAAAVPPLAWILWQTAVLGVDGVLQHAAELRYGVTTQIFAFDSVNARRAVHTLWHGGFLVTGAAGLTWALWQAARPNDQGNALVVWAVLCSVLLAWFVGASVGWARYALYPVALTACLSAAWLGRVAAAAPRTALLLQLAGFLWAGIQGVGHAQRVLQPRWNGIAEMEQFIGSRLGSSALIESWEWQVGTATPAVYVRPSLTDIYRVTRGVMTGETGDAPVSRLGGGCADYLLEGPFSTWVGAYVSVHARAVVTEEVAVGDYRLSRLSNAAPCRVATRARPDGTPVPGLDP